MKITSTRTNPRYQPSPKPSEEKPSHTIADTFRRGYVSTMIALPGAMKGGMFGAAIGLTNTLPLIPFYGLKPSLATAAVLGGIGMIAGGALSYSLASLD